MTLDECAQIRAALNIKGADKPALLERHELTEASWNRFEREHLKAIDEAVQAGDLSLLERYDDAYVVGQDKARGSAIDSLAYAKIQVGRERGAIATVLEELGIGRNELLRLDRVWRRRLAANPNLADQVEDEMERLRSGS